MKEASNSGDQTPLAANTNGSTSKEADTMNVNETNTNERVNGVSVGHTSPEEASAANDKKASLDAVDVEDAINVPNTLPNGDDLGKSGRDQSQADDKVSAKEDGEAEAPEALENPEQEPVSEDDDDEDSGRNSEIFEEPVGDSAEAPTRPKRYELSYWPDHLARAEKLWTIEEREKSDEWKELWRLVIQFICESPVAFRIWQEHYMDLDEDYEVGNTILSPLQVAAAYGIGSLVKILLDRGEPAGSESEDGRSALWFAADSPDIEIVTLLLKGGASPNARKDFPPPFHRLVWRNPKLEFVNLMLEHGADCNIMDQWGFNVMHWFALFGSDLEVLQILLKAHGDINVPDSFGETPLHKLMYNSLDVSLEMLRAFLDNGADVNKDDKESQSKSRWQASALHCVDHFQGPCTRCARLGMQRPPRCCLTVELTSMTMM